MPELATETDWAVDIVYHEYLLREEQGQRPTAAEYAAQRERIQKAIQRINKRLAAHAKNHRAQPRCWGCVGDLRHVAERLDEVAGFLAIPDSQLGISDPERRED